MRERRAKLLERRAKLQRFAEDSAATPAEVEACLLRIARIDAQLAEFEIEPAEEPSPVKVAWGWMRVTVTESSAYGFSTWVWVAGV